MPSTTMMFSPETTQVSITPDCSLTELSFSIEAIINNFLGRSVHKLSINRHRKNDGSCQLVARPLAPVGPMAISQVAYMGAAVKNGIFPLEIPESQKFQSSLENDDWERWVPEGQHRVYKNKKSNSTISIISIGPLVDGLRIGELSYGLSDMITGFFARGVNFVKWQGSFKLCQTWIEHNLTDKEFYSYLLDKQDYDIHELVGNLK